MSQILEESPLSAGRDAVARHEWHTGFDLLTQADEQEPLAAEDLVHLAEAAWWTGRLDAAIAARERAFGLFVDRGEPRPAAVVALEIAQDYFNKHAHSIGAGWFNRAERLLKDQGDCPEQGRLAVMHGLSALKMGDSKAALEAASRVLDIGMRFGDRDLQAFGLLIEGSARVANGDVQQGLSLLDEATVAAVSGDLKSITSGIIYCFAITKTAELADYERAGEWTAASERWCERQSIAGFPGVCRVHRAEIMRLRGSWTDAESEARRALAELKNFNLEYAAEGFYEIGEIRLRMGDLEEARTAFRQAHELGRDPQPGLALLYLAEGKSQAALSSIQVALEDETLEPLRRCRLLCPYVSIALTVGDVEAARTAAEEAHKIADHYDSDVLRAVALCALGEVQIAEGDARAAVQTFRKAGRILSSADLPYEAARSRMLLGVALRMLGDEDGAQLELQAARATFDKLGAVLDLRRCLELIGDDVAEGLPKAAGPTNRVVKTFMFTDIVESTNLVEVIGDEAWEHILSWHDQTMRALFADHNGQEVKHVGDGFFVAFEHAPEAVECAVAIQQRLAHHRSDHGFAPQVRIGLHTSEATRKGRDYGGKGVHAAARIGALATGGEILVSKDTLDAARPRFPTSELRSVRLKGVTGPVDVATIDPT
jgi:class 3 adenylate cyclase/Flp pilus assembly protein TadD